MTGEGQAIDVSTPKPYERFNDYGLHWYADQGVINERFVHWMPVLWALWILITTKERRIFLGGCARDVESPG